MNPFFVWVCVEVGGRVDAADIPFQSQKIIVAQPLRDVVELQRDVMRVVGGGVSVE